MARNHTNEGNDTIQELRKLFATYGLPLHVVKDNEPQFTSTDFATFMKSNGIKYIKIYALHIIPRLTVLLSD